MKNLFAVLVLSILLASAANAKPWTGKASGGGAVLFNGFESSIEFTAHIDANGDVKGEAEIHHGSTGDTFHIVIDCLSINGNRAWISGIVTESSSGIGIGDPIEWSVQDNGEGHGIKDGLSIPGGAIQGTCGDQVARPLEPLISGNFQVSER